MTPGIYVVIADIRDQALHIFLHSPDSPHKNSTLDRKGIHYHIHFNPHY